MPVFICSKCGCIENTAPCNYVVTVFLKKLPPLCSECDQSIGKWHGFFEKRPAKGSGYWIGEDGFLYDKDFPPHHTKLVKEV